MIKTVIFDFDGVIHNTLEIAFKVNKKLNPHLTIEEYKNFFNGNFYKSAGILKGDKKLKSSNEFFELQEIEFNSLKIEKAIWENILKIKNNYDLFIITSNREKTLRNYFERNNLSKVFKEILGFETHTSKVEKFKMLMKKYGITKDNCVFVTDTLGDILEAHKVGLRTIAVDFGFHERKRLEKGNPLTIISKFEEILPAIQNLS